MNAVSSAYNRIQVNYGKRLHSTATLADSSEELLLWNILTIEVKLHNLVIEVSSTLEELITPLSSLISQVSRNILYIILSTHSLIVPENSLHLDQVNYTLEVLLCTNRNLNSNRISTQDILHLLNCLKEVST